MSSSNDKHPRFNLEEAESLAEITHSDGFKILIRQFEFLLRHFEEKVLKFDLYNKSDRELAIEKARAEGAAAMLRDIQAWADKVKRARP